MEGVGGSGAGSGRKQGSLVSPKERTNAGVGVPRGGGQPLERPHMSRRQTMTTSEVKADTTGGGIGAQSALPAGRRPRGPTARRRAAERGGSGGGGASGRRQGQQ